MKQIKLTCEDLINHKYFNEIKALDNDDIIIVKFSNNEEFSFSLTKDDIFYFPILYIFNKVYNNEEFCYMITNEQDRDYFILAFNDTEYCISEEQQLPKFDNIL